jgi:hypothetical protein
MAQVVSAEPDRRRPCIGVAWDSRKGHTGCFTKSSREKLFFDIANIESAFLVGY